jgi:RNA-directed DNA polymerase
MSDNRLTRQQIYDRIRETSKDEFILQEMKRLGFWNKTNDAPSLPEQLIKKEGDLQRELNDLNREKQRYNNKEEVLKDMRRKRMEAAKEKRKATKERKEQVRIARAANWAEHKNRDIVFLGEGVSGGLNNEEGDSTLLHTKGLPVFTTPEELATAIGISIGDLKFLSYHRKVATTSHYIRFSLPKKSGGKRTISAPMPRLKAVQHWILENILKKIPVHTVANGFVTERSILTNAANHIAKDVVVNIDLKDFFPTIHYKRVKGLFTKLGYSEKIATIFSLICTEPDREEAVLDGKKYFISTGHRKLPQGAPTSPAITNIICYKLDCRFKGMADKLQFSYSRYADDLSFSANGNEQVKNVQKLLWRTKRIITDEGFIIHPDKVKVMHKGSRQEVTGIIVNKQPGIDRKMLHRFRAVIQQISKNGLENKKWKGGNIAAEMIGYANFVAQVKPAQGQKMKAQLQEIFSKPDILQQLPKQEWRQVVSSAKKNPPTTPGDKEDKGGDWWNVLK